MSLQVRHDGAFNTVVASQGIFGLLKGDNIFFTGAVLETVISPTATVTIDASAGTAAFSGFTIVGGASQIFTINNKFAHASSLGLVALQTTTVAALSVPRIQLVLYDEDTITVSVVNSSGTSTGAGTFFISFILFH